MSIAIKDLTKKQVEFLESYFEDILSFDVDLDTMSRDECIAKIAGMDFDDAFSSEPGKIRIAENLGKMGLFSETDVHKSVAQTKHIYIVLNEVGATVFYDLLIKAREEGRLPEKAASPSV